MSWFNLNDSLSNIKGQITSFASDVLADETDLKEAKAKIKELEDLCASQQEEIQKLRVSGQRERVSETVGEAATDAVWSWTTAEEDEPKRKIRELEEAKRDLENSLVQLDLDCQQSIDKLVTLKDHLQRDFNNLEEEHDALKERHEEAQKQLAKRERELQKLRKQQNGKQVEELQQQLSASTSLCEALEKENEHLKNRGCENSEALNVEIKALQITNAALNEELSEAKVALQQLKNESEKSGSDECENLRRCEERLVELEEANLQLRGEKGELHKKYINILAASMKKHMDGGGFGDLQGTREDANVEEYTTQVESVLKLLLDFRRKTESLEKELYDLREEKAKIVAEKNHEIEKLLKNSEILSQEVITKTQTIKDYEMECSELMKNNDLLIGELENYKNSSGLQTISESNEENLVLLETQLENANKKINDLESEVETSKNDYTTLFDKYETLEEQYTAITEKYSETQSLLDISNNEKEELRASIENNEYTCTELNVMQDGLKEEIDNYQTMCDELIASNKNLELANKEHETKLEVLQKGVEELHRKLLEEEEMNAQLQTERNNLMEKLQSSKMAETTLKLHFNRELQMALEAKQESESKLGAVSAELAACLENLRKLQERNNSLEETCRQFEELKLGNEQLLDRNIELLQRLKVNEDNYNALRGRFENLEEVKQRNEELEQEAENLRKALESVSLSTKVDAEEALKKLTVSETNSLSLESDFSTLNLNEAQSPLKSEYEKIIADLKNENAKIPALQSQLNELINLVNNKQQENLTYHAEIQRLNQVLLAEIEKSKQLLDSYNKLTEELQQKSREIERLEDQNGFLQGKCDVLTQNLLQQQSTEKELERLRAHLVEIEETYTQELVLAEQKNQELQAKMDEIEEREKNSSTLYTSVSIRANQQVEALQNQIQLLTSERDELRKRISDAEDENNRQAAALTNLNFVLQQFQRDKENDVKQETERIRRQIRVEKQIQQELQQEIASLKAQLEEGRQGLQAATRLGDQLEFTKKQNVALKEEVSKHQEQLKKYEAKYKELTSQTDGRVDKTLIKNLIIGLISANNNLNKDQYQILKIIATVLDFNQQEHARVNLNKAQQSSWLNSLLHPQSASDGLQTSGQSLSEAFVRFLENESKPKVIPNLLDNAKKKEPARSNGSTPRQSPIVLNEVVLPTFSDFGQSRNSSSILKDVLKDNS